MILNRIFTIAFLIGALVSLLVAIGTSNIIAIMVASFFFGFGILIWKYGYLIIPLFTRATGVVEIRNSHEIPPTRDHILKKTDNGYYASRFLEIRFYESSIDKSDEQKHMMFESFERAIASLKYVVKISLLLSAIDLSKHVEDIKTKRSAAETKKAKISPSTNDDVVRLDREISMWNRLLDRLTRGERPVEILAYASTTAFGLTKEEAGQRAKRQAKEIQTILSSSLGCDIVNLVDQDMTRCFDWDCFFPSSQEEMRDEVF